MIAKIIDEQVVALGGAGAREKGATATDHQSLANEQSGPDESVKTQNLSASDEERLKNGWKLYEVRLLSPRDCLWRIAGDEQMLGNPREWRRIYKANSKKIKNPDLIRPGQKLWIPPVKK